MGPAVEVWEVPSSRPAETGLSGYGLGTGGWPTYQERLCSLPIEAERGSPWGWRLNPRPRAALDLLQQAAAVLQGQVN